MRFCIPIPLFFKNIPFHEAIYKVRELGFDACETYNWKALDFDAVKKALAETNVELLSMCTTNFNMTDSAARSEWLKGLEESCIAAKELNVKRLITQSGGDTGAPREVQHKNIVDALKEAIPVLEKYNITLMIEPLNTLINHPGTYLSLSTEAFEIIRAVNHPLVKVVYDIYQQQVTEGNIILNITNNLDCIAHLHGAGHPGRHELQLGESDYKVIIKAVSEAGYNGAFGLEYIPTMEPVKSLEKFKEIYM